MGKQNGQELELNAIVQRMVEAGEWEDNIKILIQNFNTVKKKDTPVSDSIAPSQELVSEQQDGSLVTQPNILTAEELDIRASGLDGVSVQQEESNQQFRDKILSRPQQDPTQGFFARGETIPKKPEGLTPLEIPETPSTLFPLVQNFEEATSLTVQETKLAEENAE